MQSLDVLRRRGRPRGADLFVLTGLVGFVGAVYAVVVVGGGRFTGSPDTPDTVLSVAATAVVALGFDPVRHGLTRWAARRSGRPISTPSQVISRFLTGTSAAVPEEATTRMARAMVEGLGVESAQVWVKVSGRMLLAGAWPEPAASGEAGDPPDLTTATEGRLVRGVWHGGELLGGLSLRLGGGLALAPVEEQLLDNLTASAGLVLRNLQLTAELRERYRDTTARAAALVESRRRVVAVEDEERRRLERDIHDGAQQQLVALAVNLRVASTRLDRGADPAAVVPGLLEAADSASTELRSVANDRGRLVAEQGLYAALRAVADTSPIPARVVSDVPGRYPAAIEKELFYCCAEALQNVAKHAWAAEVTVSLSGNPHEVRATVQDDGLGFTPPTETGGTGHGLQNMAERMAAIGGALEVRSAPGEGTTIHLRVPLPPGWPTPATTPDGVA